MLVLTRKVGEEIVINGNIRVTITLIKGDKVRIGITAPPDVPVHRQEILDRLNAFAEPDVVVSQQPLKKERVRPINRTVPPAMPMERPFVLACR
jgi:carbon storage regulator